MKRFRDYDPEQPYLLPPAPVDWLPEGHLAFFIHELVQQLDLSSIYADYDPKAGGRPPLEPRMMVAVWIYAYAVGIHSSRKVQAALVEDVAFRFLSGNQQPAYWALNLFLMQGSLTADSRMIKETPNRTASSAPCQSCARWGL